MGALPSLEKAHREKADSFLFREKESAFSLIEEKEWLGLAWLGLAWLGLAWPGLAWLGLTRPPSL